MCGIVSVRWHYFTNDPSALPVTVDNTAIFFGDTPLAIVYDTSDLTHIGVYTLEYQVVLEDYTILSAWLPGMTITITDPCESVTLTIDTTGVLYSFALGLDSTFRTYNLGIVSSTKPTLCPVSITSCMHIDLVAQMMDTSFCAYNVGDGQILDVFYEAATSRFEFHAQLPPVI